MLPPPPFFVLLYFPRPAQVFDELLLDADHALNNGNWQWLSCSCFFYQYFRCYSPVAFGKKTDPEGAYIRKYVPALAKYPKKFIFEPWLAPEAVQKAAGCVVGDGAGCGYPAPMVDHAIASKENMGRMAEAYQAHKEGKAGAAGKGALKAGGAKKKAAAAKPKAKAKAKATPTPTATSGAPAAVPKKVGIKDFFSTDNGDDGGLAGGGGAGEDGPSAKRTKR
jgi:cryptochrome